MALRLYNTRTLQKEEFRPLVEGKVGMYVCGVTVYDMCHIGHARAYVAFDVIYRYLRYAGYEVKYVRNFTDVDDKIIKKAAELGSDIGEVTERFIQEFYTDMAALNVAPVDLEPRVTGHIPDIIRTVERILANGHGYVVDGEVYFDIESFPPYGKLSGRKLEDMRAGASERVEQDRRKKSPFDFVLWKASKPGEPSWPSPWGDGRPGWHIECSAMSAKHLGETFDIHGGGKDLIFPHHENEVAQSETAHGCESVHYWLHNGFVNVKKPDKVEEEAATAPPVLPDVDTGAGCEQDGEAGTKMSKSLGNFFTIRDATKLYHPETLRYFLLTTHYRSPILYSLENLEDATRRVEYVYETLQKMTRWLAQGAGESAIDEVLRPELVEATTQAFREAMDDDFNTARAIGSLSELITFANLVADAKDKGTKKRRHATLAAIREALAPLFGVLGLFEKAPETVLEGIRDRRICQLSITVEEVQAALAEREAARAARDFARSDAIRDDLAARGIALMDSPEGTTWKCMAPARCEEGGGRP